MDGLEPSNEPRAASEGHSGPKPKTAASGDHPGYANPIRGAETDPDGRIRWRDWGAAVFEEAREADRLILLDLGARWCRWCRAMHEDAYGSRAVAKLVEGSLIPLRVDGDRYPHVQRRYHAGGWPTTAFLTPSGDMLWAGGYLDARNLKSAASSVLEAWDHRRQELEREVEQRRRALVAARSQRPALGLVRRDAADDVLAAARDSFDEKNGGFGGEPKFPNPAAVELLYGHGERTGDATWIEMADRTLDGMLAGELLDRGDGGFFRCADGADWTGPHREKLLEVNAGLLQAYAMGAALRGRDDWREVAEQMVEWADRSLGLNGSFWAASSLDLAAPEDSSGAANGASWDRDPTLFTDHNATWIRALADAGQRLDRDDWIQRAAQAFDRLVTQMAAPDDLLHHYRTAPSAEPAGTGLLGDPLEAARTAARLYGITKRDEFLEHARRLVHGMENALWDERGGFLDHSPSEAGAETGALRYRERPFEENAAGARLLMTLARQTGERSYRALGERILAVLSPRAGRYGAEGAEFAEAVAEFFAHRSGSAG